MHKYQKAYAVAKAALETADAAWDKEVDALIASDPDNDDVMEAAIATANSKYPVSQLMAALRKAEDTMVEWAHEKISHSAHYTLEHKEAIAEIMAVYPRNLKVRERVVNLAFRLK